MSVFDYAVLISDFNGANQNPLSDGGLWAKLNTASIENLQRLTNSVWSTGSTFGGSYWTPDVFGPDVVSYATVVSKATGGGIHSLVLHQRIRGEGGFNTLTGFQVTVNTFTNAWGIDHLNASAAGTSLATAVQAVSVGDKIGMTCFGQQITGWLYTAGAWAQVLTASSALSQVSGRVSLGCAQSGSFDDFYAGTIQQDLRLLASTGVGA